MSTTTHMPAFAVQEDVTGKLDASAVYNGLDKTTAGYALDARQGKALNDDVAKRAKFFYFDSSYSAVNIATELLTLNVGETGNILILSSAMTLMSGSIRTTSAEGIVTRYSGSQFEFLLKYPTNSLVLARLTDVTSSSIGTYSEKDFNAVLQAHFSPSLASGATFADIPVNAIGRNTITGTSDAPLPTGATSGSALYDYVKVGNSTRDGIWAIDNSGNAYVKNRNGDGYNTWHRLLNNDDGSESMLTITRVDNSYADATSIGRCVAYKKGGINFLRFNLQITTGSSSAVSETKIATISNWNGAFNSFYILPPQDGSAKTMILTVNQSGDILITGTQGLITGFYRTVVSIPRSGNWLA